MVHFNMVSGLFFCYVDLLYACLLIAEGGKNDHRRCPEMNDKYSVKIHRKAELF